jgi:glycosyltransferase involved in cell wall biosynthesis
MILSDTISFPLISVIIPCYNHARYLPAAIDSVSMQDYPNKEIIVVDDGSSDNTKEVAANYPQVKYIFQNNSGLSAARNTGLKNSGGELLLFLDADDWLYADALKTNTRYLAEDPDLAFVSGGHNKVDDAGCILSAEDIDVNEDHYQWLLKMNYIGMHATVLYRRWVFDEFEFDTSLKACEDYDLYLRIARKYPIAHHTKKIAAYRWHNSNMSGNIPKMLGSVLLVLDRQKKLLHTTAEKEALKKGRHIWKTYYALELYRKAKNTKLNKFENALLLQYKPLIYLRCQLKRILTKLP